MQEHRLVAFHWEADGAAAAVRSQFEKVDWGSRGPYRPLDVGVDDGGLVVTFRYQGYAEVFAVRFSLDLMPEGPSTGEKVDSLEEWAEEVQWALEEELDTRMVQTAERTVTDNGLVMLRWRNPSGTT